MRAVAAAFAVLALCTSPVAAQATRAFEVATVKAAPPRTGDAALAVMNTDPGMVHYANIGLKNLIAMAHLVDSRRIQGPAWLDEQRYDVSAKLPAGSSREYIPAMLQTLLSERFRLAVHRESKEQRVYFLVVGKNGPKLNESPPQEKNDVQQIRGDHLPMMVFPGGIIGHGMSLEGLASALSTPAGYEVVDRTSLAGNYEIDLRWSRDESNGPDLFTAVQERLGLKLEPGKAPVEVLVVDHAERIPAGN